MNKLIHRTPVLCGLLLCTLRALAQAPSVTTLPSGIGRIEGTESESGITYTRLFLSATPDPTASGSAAPVPAPLVDLSLPTLTVQCTLTPESKFRFELFVNFGGVTDPAYYPPWHRTDAHFYPPRTEKLDLTLEFLGYTKVKPMKRQFEKVPQPSGQLRYNSPRKGSSNMEEIAYDFQYLRALPTFRISGTRQTATFLTAPLLAQIHSETGCHASGL